MSKIKPGMLVQLLPAPNHLHQRHAGEIHIVGRPRQDGWYMEPPTIQDHMELMWTAQFLRPLQNPGEDAKDETLLWKSVPTPSIPQKEEV